MKTMDTVVPILFAIVLVSFFFLLCSFLFFLICSFRIFFPSSRFISFFSPCPHAFFLFSLLFNLSLIFSLPAVLLSSLPYSLFSFFFLPCDDSRFLSLWHHYPLVWHVRLCNWSSRQGQVSVICMIHLHLIVELCTRTCENLSLLSKDDRGAENHYFGLS